MEATNDLLFNICKVFYFCMIFPFLQVLTENFAFFFTDLVVTFSHYFIFFKIPTENFTFWTDLVVRTSKVGQGLREIYKQAFLVEFPLNIGDNRTCLCSLMDFRRLLPPS